MGSMVPPQSCMDKATACCELDEAVRGARQSLQSFAATPTPEPTMLRANYFAHCVYTFRFLLQRVSVLKPAP